MQALLVLCLLPIWGMLLGGTHASANDQREEGTSIVLQGAAVAGNTYQAIKIASYTSVTLDASGEPESLDLETLTGDARSLAVQLSDGTMLGGASSELGTDAAPLHWKQTLAYEVAALHHSLHPNSKAMKVSDEGLITSFESQDEWQDPLVWAGRQWQTDSSTDSDPWLNTNTQTISAIRTLADWMEREGKLSEGFNLPTQEATGAKDQSGKASARFDALTPGLYLVMDMGVRTEAGNSSRSTHASPMIVGTKIPVVKDGVTTYHDLNANELGIMRVKGDPVNISLAINQEDRQQSHSYASGEIVPFIMTTNIPKYQAYLSQDASASYRNGRMSGATFPDGSAVKNTFGNQAGELQYWTSEFAETHASSDAPHAVHSKATSTTRGLLSFAAEEREDDNQTPYPYTPVRFDIVIDYDRNLRDTDPTTMIVAVGDLRLQYQSSCVIDARNTDTPCFGFAQSKANAYGERYFIVQIPTWIVRAHNGDGVQLQYTQPVVVSDKGKNSPVTKPVCSAGVEFSDSPLSNDYTDFSDADNFGAAFLKQHLYLFSYGFNLVKIDSKSNRVLEGAEFVITKDEVIQCFVKSGGEFVRSGDEPCGDEQTELVVSDDTGSAVVKGLASDQEYLVREVKQPEGYHASNVGTVEFTIRILPYFDDEAWPTEVLAAEFTYSGASYLHPQSLPAFLRPATAEWTDEVQHVQHTIYAHEVNVLNGASEQDVDAIAPFPWDVLARTGAAMLMFAGLAGVLMLFGMMLKRLRDERHQPAQASAKHVSDAYTHASRSDE